MTLFGLISCVFLVSVSAFLSASEIALFSLSRFQLRALKERFPAAHRQIKRLLSDPSGLLISILVLNEIVNISLSAMITTTVSRQWESDQAEGPYLLQLAWHTLFSNSPQWVLQAIVGTLLTAPIILFFCEVTPKVVAARANHIIASLSARSLIVIYNSFKPVRIGLGQFVSLVSHLASRGEHPIQNGLDEKPDNPLLKEEEFLFMVEEGHKEGAIHESEMELIRNVLELDDTEVSEACTPITRVFTLPSTTTLKGALATLRVHRYSRIPITGNNRKHIVGILYSKDLLSTRPATDFAATPVTQLMRKPFIIHPTMHLNVLFRKLKQYKTHIAVVEGKTGEAIGIVTMRDVLNALFEDLLEDEFEQEGSKK